jgi:hypothetical protein
MPNVRVFPTAGSIVFTIAAVLVPAGALPAGALPAGAGAVPTAPGIVTPAGAGAEAPEAN